MATVSCSRRSRVPGRLQRAPERGAVQAAEGTGGGGAELRAGAEVRSGAGRRRDLCQRRRSTSRRRCWRRMQARGVRAAPCGRQLERRRRLQAGGSAQEQVASARLRPRSSDHEHRARRARGAFRLRAARRPRRAGRSRRGARCRRSRHAELSRQSQAQLRSWPRRAPRRWCSMPRSAAACPAPVLISSQSARAVRAHRHRCCTPSRRRAPGMHPSAVIDPSAAHRPQRRGRPRTRWCGAGAVIGPRCLIGPACLVGPGVCIGADCRLVARVTLRARRAARARAC